MTHVGMPFLVINCGCEMMFVLNTRLDAQHIEREKAVRILRDIINSLFSASFMDELFRSQKLYTHAAVRQIFTTASDSSIMSLNEQSMRKLYDLMTMTVKYQLLTLRHPYEVVELTLNHLDQLRSIAPEATHALIDGVTDRFCRLASTLSVGQLASVRRELLNFSLDRHVKVSLFLDNNIQHTDGTFAIPADVYLSPMTNIEAPGTIRYYDAGQVTATDFFNHKDRDLPRPPHIPVGQWLPTRSEMGKRMTRNGINVYKGNILSTLPSATPPAAAAPAAHQQSAAPPAVPMDTAQAYSNESNLLAQMIGTGRRDAAKGEKIRLNLFADGDDDEGVGYQHNNNDVGGVSPNVPSAMAAERPDAVHVSRMDRSAVAQQNQRLLGIISGLGTTQGAAATDGTDDLLDIMDED